MRFLDFLRSEIGGLGLSNLRLGFGTGSSGTGTPSGTPEALTDGGISAAALDDGAISLAALEDRS